jgi:SAM-dependent methyltransferase
MDARRGKAAAGRSVAGLRGVRPRLRVGFDRGRVPPGCREAMTTSTHRPHLPRQPVRTVVGAVLHAAPGLRPRVQEMLWRAFYEVASFGRRDLVATMNYGYAADGEPTAESDGRGDDLGLQLYAAVVRGAEPRGKDVLEVGCGRGGGARFVFSEFAPRTLTGLDLAKTAIERCRVGPARPDLRFVVGRAEVLPFPDAAFDLVVSVESTHCYPSVPMFLEEVRRVLRPAGRLALADFRRIDATPSSPDGSTQDLQSLRDQIAAAGFRILEEEDITANVTRALELSTPAVRARIDQRVPAFLRRHALEFAAVEGSAIHRDFTERRLLYLRLVLQPS